MNKSKVFPMVLAALFLALGLILPSIFHMFQLGGQIFLPMHLPVLLCGLICGYAYGGIVGLLLPLLSSLINGGMPPLMPIGIPMMFELAVYGIACGLLIKKWNIFVALPVAMLAGRLVLGVANMIVFGGNYALSAFIAGAFVTSMPGIILQLILVPAIIILLQKAGIIKKPLHT